MAEPERGSQVRLWERPAVGWRLAALVLAVSPRILTSPMPFPPPRRDAEGIVGTGVRVDESSSADVVLFARPRAAGEGSAAEVTGDWFDYLFGSGLFVLLFAAALMLPGRLGRRLTFGAIWVLVPGAALAVFAAGAEGNGRLVAYCFTFLAAAAVLAVGGIRAALARGVPGPE
ncbi:hypothetical protein [Actinomadura sp. 21ATH]|uniref:hypothetical protein n=1 Tax=Actinomadura sp. 21ATH TaxID=1735444 RepID=UPI0035C021A8